MAFAGILVLGFGLLLGVAWVLFLVLMIRNAPKHRNFRQSG